MQKYLMVVLIGVFVGILMFIRKKYTSEKGLLKNCKTILSLVITKKKGKEFSEKYMIKTEITTKKTYLEKSWVFGEHRTEITERELKDIAHIIEEEKIKQWNGFNKIARYVVDGTFWDILVKYQEGGILHARGYMKYPKDFQKGYSALVEYLERVITERIEEKRLKE